MLLAALLALSGCTLGPDYKTPHTFSDTEWVGAPPSMDPDAAIESEWWTVFADPLLNTYITTAARENRNVRAATARIERARALRREAASDYAPRVNAEAGHTRQRASAKSSDGSYRTIFDAGLSASWEIDLFGGTRRANEAARARVELEVERRRAVLLAVLAEVARNYYDVRGVQKRISITEQNIELQSQTFHLIETLFRLGEASEFDISRARGQLQLTQSRLPELFADLHAGIYRLSVLLGSPPATLLDEMAQVAPLPHPPDLVPVGQSSELLRRRPDIRAAERELAAATADIGTVTADLFPRFTLIATAGRTGATTQDLRSSLSTRYGASQFFHWPIFQAGLIRAQVRAEKAEAEEAAATYEQTVLEALADVETALIRYLREQDSRALLQEAVLSRQRSVELARTLFNAGEENFLSVLDAERELISAEDELVLGETDSVLRLITLYTALGGGWESFEAD